MLGFWFTPFPWSKIQPSFPSRFAKVSLQRPAIGSIRQTCGSNRVCPPFPPPLLSTQKCCMFLDDRRCKSCLPCPTSIPLLILAESSLSFSTSAQVVMPFSSSKAYVDVGNSSMLSPVCEGGGGGGPPSTTASFKNQISQIPARPVWYALCTASPCDCRRGMNPFFSFPPPLVNSADIA